MYLSRSLTVVKPCCGSAMAETVRDALFDGRVEIKAGEESEGVDIIGFLEVQPFFCLGDEYIAQQLS